MKKSKYLIFTLFHVRNFMEFMATDSGFEPLHYESKSYALPIELIGIVILYVNVYLQLNSLAIISVLNHSTASFACCLVLNTYLVG